MVTIEQKLLEKPRLMKFQLMFGGIKAMINRYKAYFLVPLGAIRELGESGWEFFSEGKISRGLVDNLMDGLRLSKLSTELGMERFSGVSADAVVFLDDMNEIEHVYLRGHGGRNVGLELKELLEVVTDSGVEVFDPNL
ncbi:hypothetical protein [Xanthomonas arboricola]|uniref:hypothetical protein n=1 Tax=Xanthomonas arboricola TaxID=56448 RepID=UPI00137B13E3|nr:hypothetical protein [Xanthomonas arboricola]